MKKASKTKQPASAESIARLADNGRDISSYFTNKGKLMPPLGSLGIDLNDELIAQLNEAAKNLKVSRQALIKRFIRRGLEEHSSLQKARKTS